MQFNNLPKTGLSQVWKLISNSSEVINKAQVKDYFRAFSWCIYERHVTLVYIQANTSSQFCK